jgi:hypothetical protein
VGEKGFYPPIFLMPGCPCFGNFLYQLLEVLSSKAVTVGFRSEIEAFDPLTGMSMIASETRYIVLNCFQAMQIAFRHI